MHLSPKTKVRIFTQQVILYEDELADNGVSLLNVKVVILNLLRFVPAMDLIPA